MKEDAPVLIGFALVILTLGVVLGFFIGKARSAEDAPSWIDQKALLASWEGKPYRLVECEYVEKKEVKP